MKRMLLIVASSVLLPLAAYGEVVRWERLPLAVELLVGQERVVFVEKDVRVGVPSELSEQLRVQSAAGALYFLANAPIHATRIQLQDTASGELILLDVSAKPATTDQQELEPLRILAEKHLPPASKADQPSKTVTDTRTPIPVVLTQYASQSLYAPLRTVQSAPAVTPVPLRPYPLTTLLPHLPVSAEVLGTWRLEDFWVTAVKLTNTGNLSIDLDPRDLQGDFFSATFQHRGLGAAGDPTDTTAVYLVTRGHGLAGAILPSVSPIDASTEPSRANGNSEPRHAK